ncbi:carbohydrate ABC transporter permease [Mesobacillus foraminis]|uniref:Putative aldouronate transport system permease protein n=1 Tax=Mesobacillus foraminis TaxID=279826 RepID=A0A4R2BJY1_9BACI|nr:carbohydrate ABC transporter permease [Mesobacillus foraminis]TCN27508.1 putative aldouronate transport system permease protein [Mesobacillus foraminis]
MPKLEQTQSSLAIPKSAEGIKGGEAHIPTKRYRDPQHLHPAANAIISVLLGILAFTCVFPFLYVIVISFTSEESIVRNGFELIPKEWSMDAYRYLWSMKEALLRSYGVTILITILGTIISVFMITFYAYAISRPQFKYRRFFTFLAFFTMLFSGGLVPTYIVVTQFLDLKNTIWALILPLAMNAFYIIIMRTFFLKSVSESILESARIDGASEWRIFFQIIFPLSLPGIATVALFSTLGYWNDWFAALLYIDDPNLVPLQALLMKIEANLEFMRQNMDVAIMQTSLFDTIPQESAKMAMVVIATLPIAVSYPFFQKYFISGLTIGGVKE